MKKSDKKRFSDKFYKAAGITSPHVKTPCWIWKRPNRDGYGSFFLNGRSYTAHRVSFMIHKGRIPTGIDILHRCDNPPCVNPTHIFKGTHTDNMRDCERKGRRKHPRKTHCPHGHPYDEKNTIIYIDKHNNRAEKRCRKCANKRRKNYPKYYEKTPPR